MFLPLTAKSPYNSTKINQFQHIYKLTGDRVERLIKVHICFTNTLDVHEYISVQTI